LGIDTALYIFAGASRLFGSQLKPEEVKTFTPSGERIWIRISDLIQNPVGNRLLNGALGIIEPSAGKIVQSLMSDPRLHKGEGQVKLDTISRVGKVGIPVALRLGRNLIQPEDARARFDALIDSYLAEAKLLPGNDRFERLMNVVAFLREYVAGALRYLLPHFISIFGPTMASFLSLREIAGGDETLAFEITRSLPRNVTTEMDLMLWETALRIREDPESAELFRTSDAQSLARHYLNGLLPAVAQSAISSFMEKYGMRGVGEIEHVYKAGPRAG
jgi:pyruvate,water dikinase